MTVEYADLYILCRGNHHGHARTVDGFTTTFTISTSYHKCCEFESCSWQDVLDTKFSDKVCQRLASRQVDGVFLGTQVSSTNTIKLTTMI